MQPPITICLFLKLEPLTQAVVQTLGSDERYSFSFLTSFKEFCDYVEQKKHQIDCLILQNSLDLSVTTNWLHGQALLLPAVLLQPPNSEPAPPLTDAEPAFIYHIAETYLEADHLADLPAAIDQAITQFLNLAPACRLTPSAAKDITTDLSTQNFLMRQQRRLAEKLKERLGYLGVYYKRNPRNFYRHLVPEERQNLLAELQNSYREIVLRYFADDGSLNQLIDDYVNTAFFADIPVSQLVEIHMELIDDFAKQLKLEGRSEEILLDYRLTLIDTIAHLCEMYRRSIPREA